MDTIIKIVLFHLFLLAVQALYMSLSNKTQMKKRQYMYLAAIPVVAAFPLILNLQDPAAYSLYEYGIVFCIITAAIADTIYASFRNKDLMTDGAICSMHYSYFMICAITAFAGSISTLFRIIAVLLLAGVFAFFAFVRKRSPKEFLYAAPLALLSLACSWAFLRYGM